MTFTAEQVQTQATAPPDCWADISMAGATEANPFVPVVGGSPDPLTVPIGGRSGGVGGRPPHNIGPDTPHVTTTRFSITNLMPCLPPAKSLVSLCLGETIEHNMLQRKALSAPAPCRSQATGLTLLYGIRSLAPPPTAGRVPAKSVRIFMPDKPLSTPGLNPRWPTSTSGSLPPKAICRIFLTSRSDR